MANNTLASQTSQIGPATTAASTPGSTPVRGATTYNPPSGNISSGKGNFTFPSDLPTQKYFSTFRFYKYLRDGMFEQSKPENTLTVSLPLPPNLQERFSLNYSATGIDPVVGLIAREGAYNSVKDMVNKEASGVARTGDYQKFGSSITGKIQDTAKGFAKETAATNAARLAYLAAKGMGMDNLSNVFSRYEGVALNPYVALQFQSPELRSHSFTFRFSPSSAAESDTLRQLIKAISIRIHPSLANSQTLYTYPDTVLVTLGDSDTALYTIYESFVTSFSINYAPNGASFFSNPASPYLDPVDVIMEISLQEIKPLTAESIAESMQTSAITSYY